MNRRGFLLTGVFGGIVLGVNASVGAAPLTPTIVPAGTPGATPNAAPAIPRQRYSGDLRTIWDEPWEIEGKLIVFDAIIIQRMIADEGHAISVSNDEMRFRSLLHVDIPRKGSLFVASNDDLSRLDGAKTVTVQGVYGGMHGPGWLEPLILAISVSPVADKG